MADTKTIPFDFGEPIEFYSGYHKSLLYLTIKGSFNVDIYVPEFFPSQAHYYPLVINDFKSALQSSLTVISEKRDIRKMLADRNIFREITEYVRICLEQWNEEYGMNVSGIFPSYVSFDNESLCVMRIAEEISSRNSEMNNTSSIPRQVSEKNYGNLPSSNNNIFKEVTKPSQHIPPIVRTLPQKENIAQEENISAQKTEIKSTWKCTRCGCINDSKFCKDCGLKRQIWKCVCGHENTGDICDICKTARDMIWTCECGSLNKSRFCPECGKSRPEQQNGGE